MMPFQHTLRHAKILCSDLIPKQLRICQIVDYEVIVRTVYPSWERIFSYEQINVMQFMHLFLFLQETIMILYL